MRERINLSIEQADNGWIVTAQRSDWNSNRTGVPTIYACRSDVELLENTQKAIDNFRKVAKKV